MHAGARPAGQLEWREAHTSSGQPCFPFDHPFTPAGSRHVHEVLQASAAQAQLRPLGKARKPTDGVVLAAWDRWANEVMADALWELRARAHASG
jgi:hypothetical protein